MNNKQDVLEAISNYEIFTIKQRSILKTLASIEIDEIATITIPTLSRVTGISSAAVYRAIKVFSDEGYIKIIDDNSRKVCKFKINSTKINDIVKVHEMMKKI